MRRALFAVALLSLLLAGCRIEINVGIALEADGSGAASVDIGMDDEALAFVETTGQTFVEACSADGIGDLLGEDPLGGVIDTERAAATAEVVEEGDLTICRTSFNFDDVTALEATDDEGLNLDADFSEDRVSVRGVLPGTAGEDEGLDDLGLELGALEDIFAVNLRIDMPGKVIEHNADRVLNDGTLEWNVDLFGGSDTVIEAVSDPSAGDGGGGTGIVIIVVVVLAALAVGLFLFLRSRRPVPVPDQSETLIAAPVDPAPAAPAEGAEGFGPEGTESP